jgi:hypothetical protein
MFVIIAQPLAMKNIKTSLLTLLLALAAGLLLSTIKNPGKTMQAKESIILVQAHHCRGGY